MKGEGEMQDDYGDYNGMRFVVKISSANTARIFTSYSQKNSEMT